MTLDQELDPTPLVAALHEKTKAARLNWQATADEHAFIVSLGGDTTLKITLESVEVVDYFGNPEMDMRPVLSMLDPKGRTQWEIHSSQVKGGLSPLYALAQRIGNRLDEKMASLMEVVQKL